MLPIWFTSDHPVSFAGHSPVVFQGRRDVPEMNPHLPTAERRLASLAKPKFEGERVATVHCQQRSPAP